MTDPRPKATLLVTMSSFSNASVVAAVSKLIAEFCRCLVKDADVSARYYMAAQELAENLVKYSAGPDVSISAELVPAESASLLRLTAKNRVTGEQFRTVEERLRELTSAVDPVELYDRLILETAPLEGVSGLGLARIRAEAGFDVDYAFEGDQLSISVQGAVPNPGVE